MNRYMNSDIISTDYDMTPTVSQYRTHVDRSECGAHRNTRVRVRIRSKFRFITFLIIVLGLTVGMFGFVTGMNESTASMTQDYTSITVDVGDTLWDIANSVNHKNTDTRIIVHAICQLNDIQAGDLQPGMVLTVPTDM